MGFPHLLAAPPWTYTMCQFGALKGEEAIAWFDTLARSGPDLNQEQMATLLGDWKLISTCAN